MLRKKILLLFALIIVPMLIALAVTFHSLRQAAEAAAIIENISREEDVFHDARLNIDKLLMPANDYLITGSLAERSNFFKLSSELKQKLDSLSTTTLGQQHESLIKEAATNVKGIETIAYKIMEIKDPIGDTTAGELMEEMDSIADKVIEEMETIHKTVENQKKANLAAARTARKRANTAFIVAGVIAIGGLLFAMASLTSLVTVPLAKLQSGARSIADGDLDHRLDASFRDEFADLATGFNQMAGSLQEKIGQLNETNLEIEKKNRLLNQRVLEVYTLYNISKVLSSTLELEMLLSQVAETVSSSLHLEKFVIMLRGHECDEDTLVPVAAVGRNGDLPECKCALGVGLSGWVAMTGTPKMVTADSDDAALLGPHESPCPDAKSAVSVPIKIKTKTIGVLTAYEIDRVAIEQNIFELLTTIAGQIAIALENAQLYERTKQLAVTDGLTNIANRRRLDEAIADELKRAQRYKHVFSFVLCDIDYFKQYNDTHGHQAGDELLKRMGEVLGRATRETDLVARYGGEEFAFMLPETSKADACKMAERIRKLVENEIFPHEETQPNGNVTIGLGVATFPEDGETVEAIIKRADEALYKAKGANRNCVVCA